MVLGLECGDLSVIGIVTSPKKSVGAVLAPSGIVASLKWKGNAHNFVLRWSPLPPKPLPPWFNGIYSHYSGYDF